MAQLEGGRELLNYVNTQTHRSNLRNALDYHSVREPDLELISREGRRLFGHRSVLGIFSPMLVDIFSYTPCCQKASLMFPDTSSEILSHLLNVLYTGSTEATSDKVDVLCGPNGVFATAKLMGIDIKTDQKVIEVIDKKENIVDAPHMRNVSFRSDDIEPSLHIADVTEDEDGENTIVVEGEEEPETMEICPQIPMFDLGSLIYQQDHQDPNEFLGEEESIPAPIPVENEDYYICKLASCQTIIQFENCGARSKILNHYTSHFQRELEQTFGHLISEEQKCTLCKKDLRNFIKSKIWIHVGVTHDKTNEILVNKGIEPISVNIRMKRKASDAFREEVSPRFDESHPGLDYQMVTHKTNTCKICGQVTQNRKRLLKHYCTKHYIDRLGMMEYIFIEKNKCIHCDKDFIGAKKSSKVIHIGVEHKKIFEILEEDFGKDGYLKHDSSTPAMPPLKKIRTNELIKPFTPKIDFSDPHTPSKVEYVAPILSFHNTPRTELSMSDKMKEIQDLGNKCFVCDKKFDLFRSMLLPHYCGHFYKEIAQGHEDYFTLENCKLCGAKATKRKSRIIHLGVKHELVLPYIEDVLKNRDISTEQGICKDYEALEENHNEVEEDEIEVKQEPDCITEVVDEIVLNNELHENETVDVKTEQCEPQVVTPIRIKTINLKNFKNKEAQHENEGILKKEADGGQEVLNIRKILKTEDDHEDRKTPTQVLMKNQNKEVWITPSKTRDEVFVKRSNQYRNLDNQDKDFHLDKLYNESPDTVEDELNDECDEEEVTIDNLGLVCKFCNATEVTNHELLTHYCSHFNSELKNVSEKMIDEEHRCVECHKMLGNNKRRLYHFGVQHHQVIPMINKKLRSQKKPGTQTEKVVPSTPKKRVEEEASEDLTEEDDFEITYDQPVKIVEEHSAYKDALQTVNKRTELKPKHSNPRVCELCGCKRNSNSNLLLHYTKQHFMEDIKDRFASLIIDNKCRLCDDVIDVSMKNVGEAEKWIHIGHKHGKTNQILQEMGKCQIIIKEKKDIDYLHNVEPVIETKILETVHSSEIFQSSEDEISSSPPQPEPVEVFSCQLCDKTTKSQGLLDLHLIAIHFKREILQKYGNPENTCELCTKTLPNADAFAFHLGQDHDLLRLIMQRRAKKIAEKSESQGHSRLPEVTDTTPKAREVKTPVTKAPEPSSFPCFKCGAKRRGKKELYGHYSLQHFSKELMEEYGIQKRCSIEECGKTLENGTAWISHLGQEHPSVVDKYIPQRYWLNEENPRAAEERPKTVLKCPLKCSTPFSEQTELLTHFRVVHGFNSEIIKKVIKAHPQLNALNEENYGKGIEA